MPCRRIYSTAGIERFIRSFDEQLRLILEGQKTIDEMLTKAQAAWDERI